MRAASSLSPNIMLALATIMHGPITCMHHKRQEAACRRLKVLPQTADNAWLCTTHPYTGQISAHCSPWAHANKLQGQICVHLSNLSVAVHFFTRPFL